MASKKDTPHKIYGKLKGQYRQKSVKKRIEALFLDNIGKVVTREQIIKAATALHFYQLAIAAPLPPQGSFDKSAAARGPKRLRVLLSPAGQDFAYGIRAGGAIRSPFIASLPPG